MKYVKKTFAHKLCACFVFTSYVKKNCVRHSMFIGYTSLFINFLHLNFWSVNLFVCINFD